MKNSISNAEIEIRAKFSKHLLFQLPPNYSPDQRELRVIFSQYWRPLHYFPTFLAKTVAILPSIEQKTFVSQILFQELGEGNPNKAHEIAFFEAMGEVGLRESDILSTPELIETRDLMDLYRSSTDNVEIALGVLFATEVADLAIILGLHKILKPVLKNNVPSWVELHVKQEPDHVNASVKTLIEAGKNFDIHKIIEVAYTCSDKWNQFFNAILVNKTSFKSHTKVENISI